jgi:hypothetical protein
MTEANVPLYPPIARAAHVSGNVIMLVMFTASGKVAKIQIVSGPQTLRPPTIAFVIGWQANGYSGFRNCPIVIRYVLGESPIEHQFVRTDLQHVIVYGKNPPCLCDPPATLGKRKRWFWPF